MNLFELFVKIGADTSQAEKGMKNTQKNSETLTNKIKVMSAQFEAAQKNVDKLTKEFNESVSKVGATDKATQELAKKLADAEKEAGKFAKELNEVQKEAEQADSALDDCNEEIKDTGEKAEKSGKGLSSFASKLGKGLATAAKIGAAAVGVAAAGITALTTAAVNNYAEYEQLVGGVETLFSKSAKTVQAYAENAYKTAGLSANAYMETVTGFSASMIHSTSQVLDEEVKKEYYALAREHQRLSQFTDKESKAAVKAIEKEMAALEGRMYKTVKTEESIAKAAKLSDMAVTDMADNANKMGTSMELIQSAYQGFAKQNYSMLDNLKLGYGGTASEMYRLLQRAAELDETFAKTANFSLDSKGHLDAGFADIAQAIHIVQTEMGITGTTAKEAGRTISGSVGAMKSAWQNLITGLADGNADVGKLIDNLVTTIVGDGTEANLGVIGNVIPAIERALGGAVKLIEGAAPKIIEILPGLVTRIVPSLTSAATNMVGAVIKVVPDLLNTVVDALIDNAPALITAAIGLVQSLIQGIQDNYQILVDGAIQIVAQLATGILNMLPQIIALGLDLIVSLANGIAESLPTLIPTIMDVIMQIVETLTSPDQLKNLLDAALILITELAWGLMDAIPQLFNAINQIVMNIGWFLTDPKNIALILGAALDIIVALGTGILNAIPVFLKNMVTFYAKIFENFKNVDWGELGRNLVDGFKNGISRAWTSLKKWFKNLFGDLIGIAKKLLGIASPSKVFKKIGGFTAEGFGAGFEDEFAHVKDDMEDALNFDDASVGINASIRKVGAGAAGGAFGGTSIGSITINIDGAKYTDEQSLATAVAEAIQNMTDRRAAVYA